MQPKEFSIRSMKNSDAFAAVLKMNVTFCHCSGKRVLAHGHIAYILISLAQLCLCFRANDSYIGEAVMLINSSVFSVYCSSSWINAIYAAITKPAA